MREIKFRAWRKGKMYDGVSLEFLLSTARERGYNPNEDVEFMQFTGLRDKNGVEIYEGDIVTGGVGGCVKPQLIKWDEIHKWSGMADGYMTHRIGFMIDEYYFTLRGGEVIGNIHQNPELLDAK